MSRIISIHSFRGGTGKSNTTANVATMLAAKGLRVCVVDTDLNSPGIHVPFGFDLDGPQLKHTLNDYLWGNCDITETVHDVTGNVGVPLTGKIFLVPASIKPSEITRLLRDGYDVNLLSDGFDDLLDEFELDVLLVDTHPGLSNETILSMAITDVLVIILRPDYQDYQGTAVAVEVARKLDVQEMMLLINKMPKVYDFDQVRSYVEGLYSTEVAAIVPHSDEMMTLASQGVFALHYPNHEVTNAWQQLADRLAG